MQSMIRGPVTRACLGAALIGAVALWAALASSAPAAHGSAKASQSLTTVTILTTQAASGAPIVLGQKKGFFRAEGLDVKINTTLPPSQVVSSVLSGKMDFSIFSWGPLVTVRSNGVPIRALANLTNAPSRTHDDQQLVALKGSIKSPKQLAGKTIAVATLNGLGEVTIRDAAARAGVSQSSLKFVALNFPDMGTALRAKRIDAAFMVEPFLQLVKKQTKVQELGVSTGSFIAGMPGTPVVTSEKYAKDNPKIVAAMRKATNRSVIYARKHPKEVQKVLPGLTGQPKSVLSKMHQPAYSEKIDRAKIQRMANAMYRFGKLRNKFNVSDAIL